MRLDSTWTRLQFRTELWSWFALLFVAVSVLGCGSTSLTRTGDPEKDLHSPDPIIVRQACVDAARARNTKTIPVLLDRMLADDAAIRSSCYQCLLELISPALGSQLDTASQLFQYSFALPPRELLPAVTRIKGWHAAFTGEDLEDIASGDPVTVQLGCLRVAETENLDAVPQLLVNLRHDDFDIRSYSYTTFVALMSPEGHDPQTVHDAFKYRAAASPAERNKSADFIDQWYSQSGRAAIERVKSKRRTSASPTP